MADVFQEFLEQPAKTPDVFDDFLASDPSGVNITQPAPNLVYSNNKGIITEDKEGDYPVTFNFDANHAEWDKKGPIGWVESFKRQEKLELLPFVGGLALIDDFQALASAKRLQSGEGSEIRKSQDQKNVNDFLLKLAEEEYRGTTWFGDVYRNASILPAFMFEFAATGPVAALGRTAAKKAIGKTAKTLAGRAAKKTAELAAGAAVRTPIMANRYIAGYNERQIFANVAITDKGMHVLEKSDEEPHISAVKAVGDTFVEVFSETVGPFLRIPVGKGVSKISPKFVVGAKKFWDGIPVKVKVARILEKGGFDGILEEMGEERVGDLLRASFNLEDFGAEDGNVMDRLVASIPDWYQLSVEAGTFAIPGAASFVSTTLTGKLRRRGVESPETVVKALSENERVVALDSIQVQEDDLFERALNKVGAYEDLTEEEQAVVEDRYFEYVERGEITEPVEDVGMLEAMKKADREQEKAVEKELKLEFPKGKAEEVEDTRKIQDQLREKYPDLDIFVFESDKKDVLELSQVSMPKDLRGKGVGTNFMNDLISYADKVGKVITLTPDKTYGGTIGRLKEFYKRFGFVENKGRNKDFRYRDTFYRSPQELKEKELKLTPYQQAEQKLIELKQQKAETQDILKSEKELLIQAEEARKPYLRSIKPTPDFKDELSQIPAVYKSKESTQALDQIAQREGFDDVQEFVKMLSGLEENVKSARVAVDVSRETIRTFREKTEAKSKLDDLNQKVKAFNAGVRSGEIKTKEDIKKVQTEFINLVKGSSLLPKDKLKFVSRIKEITDVFKLKAEIKNFREKSEVLFIAEDKKIILDKIRKALETAKPVKKGQRKVAKYDYTTNKLLQDIIGYQGMTKKDAQMELFSLPEPETEADLMRMRALSLIAGGMKSSPELYAQVFTDIMTLKDIGSKALSEADFEARLERGEKVDEVMTAGMLVKGDKKTIKTKIGNSYRRGFSNQWSMDNSIYGKKVADKYNMESVENDKDIAIGEKSREMKDAAKDIYETENVPKLFAEMERDTYELVSKSGTDIITKHELIDIYNSLKNKSSRESYYAKYGQVAVDALMLNLPEDGADRAYGDYLQEFVQEYLPEMNQRNIEITGQDLRTIEHYWPRTSEREEEFFDGIRQQGETPGFMKGRSLGTVDVVPGNAYLKAQKHMAQAEHVKHISREYEKQKRLFSNAKVKKQIINKFGEDVYKAKMAQIDSLSLNAETKKIDMVTGWMSQMLNNWVTAKIALSPTTFARQLGSATNYAENMKTIDWIKGFKKGVSSPKETFDYMWDNAPFLEERFGKGYSEALGDAISGAEEIGQGWGDYTKFLTAFGRSGDILAIVYGGYPLVKSEMAKGKTKEEAFETFRKATFRTQQSRLKSSTSAFQNQGGFTKLLTAFKNTTNQYLRKMADAMISYQNGDIDITQLFKTLTMYGIIQPTMYATTGAIPVLAMKVLGDVILGDDDEVLEEGVDKLFNDIMVQIMTAPVNAIPLIDDVANVAARKATGQKVWKVMNMPMFDDLENAGRKLLKKNPDAEDYLTAFFAIQEPFTGLPFVNMQRYYNYFSE